MERFLGFQFSRRWGQPLVALTFILGLVSCASAPDRQSIQSQQAAPASEQSTLYDMERALRQRDAVAGNASGAHLLSEGTRAYAARLAIIASASETLDVQYYLFHQDPTGTILSWSLWEAAERGVRVRLLLDDMEKRPGDFPINILASHPNIHVRMYNPFYWRGGRGWQLATDFGRLNHRMHNKSLTADNRASIIGGRNVGDEYFAANQEVNFGDMDALLFGPVVRQVSEQFDRYWNSELVFPLHLLNDEVVPEGDTRRAREQIDRAVEELEGTEYAQALVDGKVLQMLQDASLPVTWAPIELWYDTPDLAAMEARDSTNALVINRLLSLFSQASSELFLISPYFVPRDRGSELLSRKAAEGLKVSVVTNALAATDVVAVHAGYAKKREQLLEAGVKLYEIKARPNVDPKAWSLSSSSSLHAKTFVIDRRWVFVGSFNLDPRSAWLNTEMGVLIDSPALAEQMLAGVNDLLGNIAYQVSLHEGELRWQDLYSGETFEGEPHADWTRRSGASMLRWLPIESQL